MATMPTVPPLPPPPPPTAAPAIPTDPLARLPGPMRVAVWMALAGAAFAAMGGLIKFAARDLHPFEVAFFRCFFGLPWLSPWLLRRGPAALRHRGLPLADRKCVVE